MANLTLSIDSDLLKKSRKIAIDKDTSVNALVREFLEGLVRREIITTDDVIIQLKDLYEKTSVQIDKIRWTREELYNIISENLVFLTRFSDMIA